MPAEESTQDRNGMRKFILQIAQDNPINLDIIEELGQFPTRKAAAAWMARQISLGTLTVVGTMRDGNGRMVLSVCCQKWKPKEDNLRHEIIGTRVRLLYPMFECERGYKLNDCYPDMLLKNGEDVIEIEIDCGSLPQKRVKARWKQHKCEHDILVVTWPKAGDPDARVKQLLDWSDDLGDRGFFTTLSDLKTVGPFERVWDFIGRGKAPKKRVKLPVLSACESYIENTPQTVTGEQEDEEVEDHD